MKKFLLIMLFALPWVSLATHNRAGEITFSHVSGLRYKIILRTYTKDSAPADRPELVVRWGDGTQDTLIRSNGGGNGVPIGNDIKLNEYIGEHVYPAPGTYTVSMEDPNRNEGVINIPNSIQIPFYIESTLLINPNLGYNNSPILLNPPIDNGCLDQIFIHNPAAFDVDGDSLSYKLVPCRGFNGLDIPNYSLPQYDVALYIDSITGDFIWDSPQVAGEYNIAIEITEHRKDANGNWVVVGRMVRDMQIDIAACTNRPPVIQPLPSLCVEAGDSIAFNVFASDPDFNTIRLNATGGPFVIDPTANFTQGIVGVGNVTGTFEWRTDCAHVRQQPYYAVFKAEDNGNPKLVDIESAEIYVVAPRVENPSAESTGAEISLKWQKNICSQAVGYDIYRREGSFGFVPSDCETGVPEYTGYTYLASTSSWSDTSYIDDNLGQGLNHGVQYCYMIVALFDDGAESYASQEVCAVLKRDVPIMTKADVVTTDASAGIIDLEWVKATEHDTLVYPGPYAYKVYMSEGLGTNNWQELVQLSGIDNTNFTVNGLNTQDLPYTFRVEFLQEGGPTAGNIGFSDAATSVFLTSKPSNKTVNLEWFSITPWQNDSFAVFRFNPGTSVFDSIGVSYSRTYKDEGLENFEEYCYYVKAYGSYTAGGLPVPLINRSQELCETPYDTAAPCAVVLEVEKNCDLILNDLSWAFPDDTCGSDVVEYNIYFTPNQNQDFELIQTNLGIDNTTYTHQLVTSLAGCYLVEAVDSFGNASDFSNLVCVDNCPSYELPNVFSPNGDNINDLFHPISTQFVLSVKLIIYNRWGSVVYETNDPMINWDGKHYQTNQDCSEGTYYYVAEVTEDRLEGPLTRELSGFLTLFR
jgi:gliding motility-associated-like protein